MKLAFVANFPVGDIRSWSGIVFHAHQACVANFATVSVLETPWLDRMIQKIGYYGEKIGIDLLREPITSKLYNLILRRQISKVSPDIIIAIACSPKIAALAVSVPILHMSDATFNAMLGYYPTFSHLQPRTVKMGDRMEQHVLDRCAAALLTSDWAAQSARDHYRVPASKIHVVPMGASLSALAVDIAPRRWHAQIRLLFIGVEWQRKGGDIAFDVLRHLRSLGADARLDIVGCLPPAAVMSDPGVICHGFLRKDVDEEAALLDRLQREAGFFILPSRQEAFGLVFCEASAYGLPILATRTGGVSTIVQDGINGMLFDPGEPAAAYVDAILMLQANPDRYAEMSRKAIRIFSDRLTWQAWGRTIHHIASEILENRAHLPAAL
jgi:glycosyltransferase involved in cell wall biosynthesis